MPLPQRSCHRMTIQISFKGNNWRGTTGSSILDHDLGHLCRGRRIQTSRHSVWELSIILEHLPFLPGYKEILRQLLVLRNLEVWIWYPWLLLQSFEKLMILVQWILRKTPESSFTISPRSTTQPLYFWCFASNSAFFRWHMSINDAKWTVAPVVLASSITFLLLTFVKFHAEIFSIFPIPCPLRPLLQEFSWLEA